MAPSFAGLDWLSARFERHYPNDLPLPQVYPMPEGGIEAEWSLGAHGVIFEIDLDNHRGNWLQFAKESDDDERSETLNLDEAAAWQSFAGEIRRLSAPEAQG